ncbi:MAG: hypothetical protein HQL77_19105 [Magnetococcales bacterium]|nr:hypothetical protein [Magnetococcales bacterium]
MSYGSEKREYKPLVKLTGLYENKSKKTGETYFAGFLGSAKVLIMKDKNAEPAKPSWTLFVQEKPDSGQAKNYGEQSPF